MDTLDRMAEGGIVAVLRGVDDPVPVAEALVEGGVTAVELTVETPGATDRIAGVADAVDAAVGAGTVLDAASARAAVDAGAEFVVGPTLEPDVIETCSRHGVVVAPGVLTPTEALRAVELGADLVKLFPATTVGPAHVAALRGPLPQVEVMPTGGVDLDDVADFVSAGARLVGVGSALVDRAAVTAGDYGVLTETARTFVEEVNRAP